MQNQPRQNPLQVHEVTWFLKRRWLPPLLTVAHSPVALLVLAALLGAGQSLVFPATIALVAVQVNSRHLGAGMGLLGTMQNAGKVVGPVLAGLLLARMDYPAMFGLLGILLLAGALLVGATGRRFPLHSVAQTGGVKSD